jgi:hypothetical protein
MVFTTESLQPVEVGPQSGPTQFNLPAKEFVGYDKSTAQEAPVVETGNPASVGEQIQEEVQLSPKLTAIARKEQAQRAKEKAFADKERSFSEKMSDAEKFHALKKRLADKDYTALDELGISYEEYVKHEINKESSKDPAQAKVKELEERLEALQKAQEEKEVQDYETNQSLWKQEIKKAVDENPEFSTIKDLGAYEIVLQHVNDSFEEDGVELTVEEAAKEIEEALVAKAEKFASVTKIKNKAQGPKVLGAPPKPTVKTITQNLTTTPKTSASRPFHMLSESEQIAEAIRRVQAEKLKRQG